ncbi:MAG TPA: hypothetical protein VMQ44_00735 [Candidatus Saccharimonadales bacterium]|nr:hypothetical protein [Candidatus Saccharimonadales bacterium]
MNSKTATFQRLTILWVVITLGFSYYAQLTFDSWLRFSPPMINTTYNIYIEPQPLGGSVAKNMSFGMNEALADWYWLQMIQYYGGGDPNGQYRKLPEMFNTITDLSPKFLEAYQTGLIILPGEGYADQAISLGNKGMQNLPDSWEMPYYTGLVYHIYKKDYNAAAHLFDLAASKPGAPANTKYFAAIYYNSSDQRQIAYQIFQTVYSTTTDSFIKDRAGKYLTHLQIIFFLQDATKTFHDRFGRYPSTLNELVTKNVIIGIPDDPINIPLSINSQTGEILEVRK